jgi:hypothetical protein
MTKAALKFGRRHLDLERCLLEGHVERIVTLLVGHRTQQ